MDYGRVIACLDGGLNANLLEKGGVTREFILIMNY